MGLTNEQYLNAVDVYRAGNICQKILRMDLPAMVKTLGFESLEAHVTLVLIHLNELLQRADGLGRRVDFADDVEYPGRENADVSDLINRARGAACHIGSQTNRIGEGSRFVFNVIYGKHPTGFEIHGKTLGCPFEGELAIFYGETRILLERHLRRAFATVIPRFEPELTSVGMWKQFRSSAA